LKEKHILALALILLALATYYSVFEADFATRKPGGPTGPPILLLHDSDVKRVEIQKADGRTIRCERTGYNWRMVEGVETERWNETIEDFVAYFVSAPEVDKFSDSGLQLSEYGLDTPGYRITITDLTDKPYHLLVGNTTPVGVAVYAKFAESPQVIIVGALLNWELS
jgi:hypothetical protein